MAEHIEPTLQRELRHKGGPLHISSRRWYASRSAQPSESEVGDIDAVLTLVEGTEGRTQLKRLSLDVFGVAIEVVPGAGQGESLFVNGKAVGIPSDARLHWVQGVILPQLRVAISDPAKLRVSDADFAAPRRRLRVGETEAIAAVSAFVHGNTLPESKLEIADRLPVANLCVTAGLHAPIRNGTNWDVPLGWISMNPLRELCLVAEDLNDTAVLVAAGVDSLNRQGLKAFRVRVQPINGGGGNTDRSFALEAIDRQRIAICFADSDKECPHASMGGTASKCALVAGAGLFEFRTSQGRALENALPYNLLDVLRPIANPKPSVAHSAVEALSAGAAKFANLKFGISNQDLRRLAGSACQGFWSNLKNALGLPAAAPCCGHVCAADKSSVCQVKLVPGLGSSLLGDAANYLSATNDTPNRMSKYLPSPGAEEWESIGKWVADYAFGLPARRI